MSLEQQLRLEQIVNQLEETGGLGPQGLRLLRAIQVLHSIGSEEAHQVLHTFAQGDPHDWLARQAQWRAGKNQKGQ